VCYLLLLLLFKVSGAQSLAESAASESKSEGDKFQIVVDTANTAVYDANVTEEPSSQNKGLQNTRDADNKDLTVAKSSAQQSTVTSNDKNITTQHDSSDKQNKNKSGITAKNDPTAALNKSKSIEDEQDKDASVSKTESTVQGSNSTSATSKTVTDKAVTEKAVTDKAVTDKAVAGTMLSAGAAKSLTEAISKDRKEIKNAEQTSVVDGSKDAMVSADLHHIGGKEKEEKGGERKDEQREKDGDLGHVDAEEEEEEEEEGDEEDEERDGLELELGSSVDDSKYFKNTYSETASSEGCNSDSIRSIEPHANTNKTVEPTSPTSRYARLD
jgi:hypothetical protein